jgi:poly(3-hydroxybutyrate) depolymerase
MVRYLYGLYRAQTLASAPIRHSLRGTARALDPRSKRVSANPVLRRIGAASEVLAGLRLTHRRPDYDVDGIEGPDGPVTVHEAVSDATPFASLLHFRADTGSVRPQILLVTALSGHFSTLLEPTLRTLLRENDVYVTDWHNARDIPVEAGRFGFDEFVDHVVRFIRHIGPEVHVLAICQPCPAVLAAVAVLAEDAQPLHPRSLTLMAGPIDTRVNPSRVNEFGNRRSVDWFRDRCVTVVPRGYSGAGRHVYPGFLQVSAFMSLNPRRHLDSHFSMYRNLVTGDLAAAAATRQFYDQYFAVLDVTAEFYLETIQRIFIDHDLPRGQLTYHGQLVRPEAIRHTPVLTVEAERDEMCTPGQTEAAHTLLRGLTEDQRQHYMQPGVGHYGIFSGKRWENEIHPLIRNFIRDNS